MQTSNLLRRHMIESLVKPAPGKDVDTAIFLWERMATRIISIIGEEGFHSLYARSIFLSQPTFPWLASCTLPPQSEQRFAQLRMSLEARSPTLASDANRLLLITFTDTLATLIGEQLTTGILRSAWGNDALDGTGKELKK